MKKTIRNLLLASILFAPIAMADDNSFAKALWDNDISYAWSDAGLFVVFGELADYNQVCRLAEEHDALVEVVVNVDRTKRVDC